MNPSKKIYVTGHRGLVGSAILRYLRQHEFNNIVFADHKDLDLTDPVQTRLFFMEHRPAYVFHCAAWVGGIMAHTNHSTDAIIKNCAIQNNVMESAADNGVEKLLFLSSACAYPKHATVPLVESSLLTSSLEESNKGYALCKIMGIELCNAFRRERGLNFISAMPTNLYGIGDSYDLQNSHVIPGMMHRIHLAKIKREPTVTLWGSGKCSREFLWSDDMARACVTLMEKHDNSDLVNLGSGESLALRDLASLIAEAVGYTGEIVWDTSKPDGTPVRYLDNSRIRALGWVPKVTLRDGLPIAYNDFLKRYG